MPPDRWPRDGVGSRPGGGLPAGVLDELVAVYRNRR
jgi:hypothetical protein